MAKPYSEDLRRRVIDAVDGGATIPEAGEQCGVSISSVVRFLKLQRETGSVGAAKFGGYKEFVLASHEELVRGVIEEQPDITLVELKARLAKKNVSVSKSSISRFLIHLKLPFKKKVCGPPSKIGRMSPPRVSRCDGGRRYSIQDLWYSSMKPAFPRQSRVSTAGLRRVSGSCKRCCTGTGRLLHSLARCVTTALPRHLFAKAQ
jgi:transposase